MTFEHAPGINATVMGRPAVFGDMGRGDAGLTVFYPRHTLVLETERFPGGHTADVLRRIAEHLTWAPDITDPGTWFDGTTV